MGEENRKQGRKSGGRKHGGRDMKRAGKGYKATKRIRSGKAGGLTLLERERRALAEAAPLAPASVSPPAPPAPPSPPEIAPRPTSFGDLVEQASVPAAPAPASPETEALREGVGVRPVLRGGMLAVLAVVAAVVCGLALLRACEREETPIEDDGAEINSCSDDAALCVAQA